MTRSTAPLNTYINEKLSNRSPGIVEDGYFVSAVLLPLIEKQNEINILFEVRSQNLDWQPGDICFPGGKVEEDECSKPQETALRETSEELGIAREEIQLIGPLDILVTPLGRLIYPFVGTIVTEKIKPNPIEVAEIFTVPLEFLLNNPPTRNYVEVATRYGSDFPFEKVSPGYKPGWQKRWEYPNYSFQYKNYFIWGLTARILFQFLTLCWPDNINYKHLKGEKIK